MAIKNIIEELNSIQIENGTDLFIENKVNHLIVSAINISNLIEKTYSAERADDLIKSILLSIKTKNPRKFRNKIRKTNKD